MNFSALTVKPTKPSIVRAIHSECVIAKANTTNFKKYKGLWDTGATSSVITEKIVTEIGLIPISKTDVYHAGGKSIANVYLVNIILPNNVKINYVTVTEGKLMGCDVLIGMDVITLGDLSITNFNGSTTFSFRVPSKKEVDFVKEINNQARKNALFSKGKSKNSNRRKSKRKRRR